MLTTLVQNVQLLKLLGGLVQLLNAESRSQFKGISNTLTNYNYVYGIGFTIHDSVDVTYFPIYHIADWMTANPVTNKAAIHLSPWWELVHAILNPMLILACYHNT